MSGTALAGEIRKFDALAAQWWDPRGPMAPLHAMNPLRCGWIAEQVSRYGRRPANELTGLRVLDVGCGAGLASEWMARRGAAVTGVDAAGEALAAARAHAALSGLAIEYHEGRPEALPGTWDAVLALEVVEHVANRGAFLEALAQRVRPGGLVFLSTLNRTPLSFLLAKLGAEYVLRWLPRDTHDWRMFVTPSELGAGIRAAGMRVVSTAGVSLNPLSGRWQITRDLSVNYLIAAERA